MKTLEIKYDDERKKDYGSGGKLMDAYRDESGDGFGDWFDATATGDHPYDFHFSHVPDDLVEGLVGRIKRLRGFTVKTIDERD